LDQFIKTIKNYNEKSFIMLTPGREHPDQQRRQGGGQPEVQEVRKSLPYVHAGKETLFES
jgi:hypothetical protein